MRTEHNENTAMRHFCTFLLTIVLAVNVQSQSLLLHWQLVKNDAEPGVAESSLRITNRSADTLTATGDWFIGCCWMSVHPYHFDGELLKETEVCATYHEFRPTADFIPLPPGETYEYRILQKGSILRESNGPQGAFFVAHEGATPVEIPVSTGKFTFSEQWTRKANPGYADGQWTYHYNEQWCRPLPAVSEGTQPAWVRPLNIVPQPKEVTIKKGTGNLNAQQKTKTNSEIPAEGYRITLSEKKILIEASDEAGFFYAGQTIERLRENNASVPAMVIYDYPELAHRGLMLDIARNYTDKREITRLLDVMAMYKLNVFHFHLVDDEGWRLEIPGLPELTETGSRRGWNGDPLSCLYPAYNGGSNPDAHNCANGYLTREDYIEIVRYAAERHIRVIPEIDMPGHSRAAIVAMEARYQKYAEEDPEEAERYRLVDPQDTSHYSSAQYYTDNVICIARQSCYNFAGKIIRELSLMHEEAGQPLKVFHVGGDEVASGAWKGSPMCRDFMDEHGMRDTHELKDYFLRRVIDSLRPYGIQVGGWEEIAMRGGETNPVFANENVLSWCWNSIPEWKGDEKAYRLANAGYPVVLACVGNLYLDMCYTHHQQERGLHWGGYTDEHSTFDFLPFDIYRSVRITMKREDRNIDEYDRNKTFRLRQEARKNIVGMQGQLFAETIREDKQLEEYIFPKLIGLAERAWNPSPISYMHAKTPAEGKKAFETERQLFSQQLYKYEIPRLVKLGIAFHLAQPGIMAKEERIGGSFYSAREKEKGASKKERTVYINHPVPGVFMRYTTDGSEPGPKSSVYMAPFVVAEDAVVKAKAYWNGAESATTILLPEPKYQE